MCIGACTASQLSALSCRNPSACLTSNATLRQPQTRDASETNLLPLSPPSPNRGLSSYRRLVPPALQPRRLPTQHAWISDPAQARSGYGRSGQIGPARMLCASRSCAVPTRSTAQSTHYALDRPPRRLSLACRVFSTFHSLFLKSLTLWSESCMQSSQTHRPSCERAVWHAWIPMPMGGEKKKQTRMGAWASQATLAGRLAGHYGRKVH